jgi:hypothetical protein
MHHQSEACQSPILPKQNLLELTNSIQLSELTSIYIYNQAKIKKKRIGPPSDLQKKQVLPESSVPLDPLVTLW